jgi:maltooligosyltrehalose trehalohydrolase
MEISAYKKEKAIFIHRWNDAGKAILVMNFSDKQISVTLPFPVGLWRKQLDSADEQWQGKGSAIPEQINAKGEVAITFTPWALALFIKEI